MKVADYMARQGRRLGSGQQWVTNAGRKSVARAVDLIARAWRPIVFLIFAFGFALAGFVLRPNDSGIPQAEPGAVERGSDQVNRTAVSIVGVVALC